jgi:hypothetical protein
MTPQQKADRIAEIFRMRGLRYKWDAIGAAMDPPITGVRACQIYKEGLTDHPVSAIAIDEYRAEELILIDDLIQRMLIILMDSRTDQSGKPTMSPRTKVEAVNAIKGLSERKAKLLGLDAPAQVQVTSISAMDMEIRRMEIEMGYKPGQEIPAL